MNTLVRSDNGREFAGGVTLDPNTTPTDINGIGVAGGLGRYAIGSFTADAMMQQFPFFGSEVGVINGFQLRLDGMNSVPETGSAMAFFGLALLMPGSAPPANGGPASGSDLRVVVSPARRICGPDAQAVRSPKLRVMFCSGAVRDSPLLMLLYSYLPNWLSQRMMSDQRIPSSCLKGGKAASLDCASSFARDDSRSLTYARHT